MKRISRSLYWLVCSALDWILEVPCIRRRALALTESILANAAADTRSFNKRIAAASIACWIYQQLVRVRFHEGIPAEGIRVQEQLRAGLVIYLTFQRQDPVVEVSWGYWPGNEELIREVQRHAQVVFEFARVSSKFEDIDQK